MNMKRVAIGVCALAMSIGSAYAAKTGDAARAEGKITVESPAVLTLTLDNPDVVLPLNADNGSLITDVTLVPDTDSKVWVGYEQGLGDGVHGVAMNGDGDTMGIWLNSGNYDLFTPVGEMEPDTAVSLDVVRAGRIIKNTLEYAETGGKLTKPGVYTYALNGGFWTE